MQKTILLVEDEDILREIVKDYLLNEGFGVLEAADGKEALTIFENHEVHLMILDIMFRIRWMVNLSKGSENIQCTYHYVNGTCR